MQRRQTSYLNPRACSPWIGARALAWSLFCPGMVLAQTAAPIPNARNPAAPSKPSTQPITIAQVQSLDRVEAEQARLRALLAERPQRYVDKVMDESALPPPSEDSTATPSGEEDGLSTWLFETRAGGTRQSSNLQSSGTEVELGARAELRRETLSHGEWVLQADLRHQNSATVEGAVSYLGQARQTGGERVSLRNLGFPITTSTFADTTVGDLGSEITDGLARGYRLSLGTSAVRGLGTRVFSRNFDLRAGTGARGQMLGGPYPGFERATGQLSWLGYTHRWNGDLHASAQIQRATDVAWNGNANAFKTDEPVQSTSVAAAVGWGDQLNDSGAKRLRLIVLSNHDAAEQSNRSLNSRGAFLEAAWLQGRYRNEAGLYATDPQLRFGDQWVSDGGLGAYWRMDHLGIRTSWGIGLNQEAQKTNTLFNTQGNSKYSLSSNFQHRIDGRNSVGGNLFYGRVKYDDDARATNGQTTTYATVFAQTRQRNWGDSRLRLTMRRNQALVSDAPAATGEELEWEQDWIVQSPSGSHFQLQTTLGWARDRSNDQDQVHPTAGLRFRQWVSSDWNVGASLRHSSRRSNLSTSRGLSGSLDSEYHLGRGWQMGASLYLNQTVSNAITPGNSAFGSNLSSRSDNASAYIFLRFDGHSGQGFQNSQLNGQHRVGAGSISGQVFYDADRDGLQQATESGVAGVEVWLDQRYRVTTDAQGNFEFPVVSTGSRQLTLKLESVPLPWGASSGSRLVVEVPLRGRVLAPIPVVKTGE